MMGSRYLSLLLAIGLAAHCGCGALRPATTPSLLLQWAGRDEKEILFEDINLFSDGTALVALRYQDARSGKPLLAKTYRLSGRAARNRYAGRALELLSPIAPPQPPVNTRDAVATLYEGDRPAITIAFRGSDFERYPVWRGLHQEIRQRASCDLLAGLFFRDMAELYVENEQGRANLYLEALENLEAWADRLNREQEYPALLEYSLETRPVRVFFQLGRYRSAIEQARSAWSSLTERVTVTTEAGVEVVVVKDIYAEFKELIDRAEREADGAATSTQPGTTTTADE